MLKTRSPNRTNYIRMNGIRAMNQELEIPYEVPVMTLSSTVLFPQAIMPLHIFEPRYREMLKNVLSGDRIFAVAALNEANAAVDPGGEPPHSIAGVGIVRACRTNEDGTSNLVLQGLARVKLEEITRENPYRTARIRQVASQTDGPAEVLQSIKPTLLQLIETQRELGAPIPKEVIQFLGNVADSETVLDLSIYTLCGSGALKQELLETREVVTRFDKFETYLQRAIEQMRLDSELKGDLGDESVGNN